MSDYLRPEYTPLFTQVQDFIADQLNTDPQLSALGIEFLPEHRLDIEYEIKNNLGKQGTVGIVNTLKGTYGGHNGSTNAWEIEAEVDVLENPPVRRAQMKKMGLSAGTTADILDWVQESLCGPSSPTYGKFCAMSQELGEDRGIIVGRSIMKTFAIADVSAVISGENHWVCPYALQSDLSALSVQVADITADIHGDYIEDDEGNRIDADRTFTWKAKSSWFVSELNDGYYTYDPPLECAWGTYTIDNGVSQTQTQMWMSKTPYSNNEYFGIGANLEYVEYYSKSGDIYVVITGDMIAEHTDNAITMIGMSPCSITRTGEWSDLTATLATIDDLPTKTSELTNDSGFITSAQVEPYPYVAGYAQKSVTSMTVASRNTRNNGREFPVVLGTSDEGTQPRAILNRYFLPDWNLSQYDQITYDTPIKLTWQLLDIKRKIGPVSPTLYNGYGWISEPDDDGRQYAIGCANVYG